MQTVARETYSIAQITLVFTSDGPSCEIKDWSAVKPGTLVYLNADRFGLANSGLFIGKYGDMLLIALASICYDPAADEFICSDKPPPLPRNACTCYTGQGYSRCSCVARNTKVADTIAWFRANRAQCLDGNIITINLAETDNGTYNSQLQWWECSSRDVSKTIFSPNDESFPALCLSDCGHSSSSDETDGFSAQQKRIAELESALAFQRQRADQAEVELQRITSREALVIQRCALLTASHDNLVDRYNELAKITYPNISESLLQRKITF